MAKNYLDKDGLLYFWQMLKSKFVKQEPGKGLSTNDFTTTEKEKLAGIAANANKYTLPSASSSVRGGIKVGGNLTVAGDVLSLSKANVTTALGYTPLTEGEINEKISKASSSAKLERIVVSELPPVSSANINAIYMLTKKVGGINDGYDEYYISGGEWERLGSGDVDLSGYMKTSDLIRIENSEIDTIVKQ